MTVYTQTDHEVTTEDGVVTLEDINEFHNSTGEETGDNVTVAVMDSGVDPRHPVFDNVELEHHDFAGSGSAVDEMGHGTAVAGTIAQIAPDAKIISLRILDDSGRGTWDSIAGGYGWLLDNSHKVDIVNMSIGFREKIQELDDYHNEFKEKTNIQDVVAAGNSGDDGGSPATATGAFSVGALNENGEMTRFSSYDEKWDNPDIAALGRDIKLPRANKISMGQVIDANWTKSSGTSFAAPIVSGFMARYKERTGEIDQEAFETEADDIQGTPRDGEGILDYGDLVTKNQPTASSKIWQFAGSDMIYLGSDWMSSGSYKARLKDKDEDGITIHFDTTDND